MKFNSIPFMIISFLTGTVYADVIPDGTAGSSAVITPVDGNYDISYANGHGHVAGANLFHSFTTFDIEANNTATFSGPDFISNIVTRVTGDNPSTINGRIVSTIPEANLWMINSKGITFGNGASVDVQGSFHASTADYVRMRDDTLYATDTSQSQGPLTSALPKAFGFYDEASLSGDKLVVQGAKFNVPEGEHISLVGNDIDLRASVFSAPGGQVSVVSINEGGEVYYSDQGFEAFKLDTNGDPNESISFSGSLSISSTAFKVEGDRQGNLQVQGGDIEINTHNTDFVSTVSTVKVSFSEDVNLLEKPCELAEFYGQGSLAFTVDAEDEETRFGVEVKKARSGALGALPAPDCL